MNALIDSLRAKSTETNQATVARELRITQAMLSMVLAGKRRIGRKVLVGIVNAYPELTGEAIEHLRRI